MRLSSLFLLLFFCFSAFADDQFTAAETQQISIATPGLFDKTSSFTIDLAAVKEHDYSFPLQNAEIRQRHRDSP